MASSPAKQGFNIILPNHYHFPRWGHPARDSARARGSWENRQLQEPVRLNLLEPNSLRYSILWKDLDMGQSHMEQLLLAIANVDELLKVLPAPTLYEHVGAIKDLQGKLGKYTRKKAPSKRGPETILRSLEKRSDSLRRYLSHPKDALETRDRKFRDVRVQDVLSWEKQTQWPFVTALRRGLAGRSLALQHHRWEKRMFGASRLDDFTACFDSGSTVDNADGTIPEFLNAHGLDRVDGITHAIRTGVKSLVLEIHCASKKSVCGLPLFCPGDLYRTKISDLRRLRTMLEDHQCLHALANEHEGWYDQFVAIYEGKASQLGL